MDKESLLRWLNERRLRGHRGGRVSRARHARATLDIDIFIRPTHANAQRQYTVELDVHPYVAGADFEGVWSRRVAGLYGRIPVAYASLSDLIAMKEAAAVPRTSRI